ncbi:UNVERIFIED_CONTAM: hypothetical protein FKN15_029982 [Acipenser sinensis]
MGKQPPHDKTSQGDQVGQTDRQTAAASPASHSCLSPAGGLGLNPAALCV